MRIDRNTTMRWARWLGSFIGFPLAGVAARLAVGSIDGVLVAVVGGAIGGAVLGAVQVAVGGVDRADRLRWIGATAAGFAVGLGAGASAVGFETTAERLVLMGAISGAGVGAAQALAVSMRLVDRVLWAVATPLLWAAGWAITSQVIVDADRQHAVFGSSGALAVSAAAGVLVARRRPAPGASTGPISDAVSPAVAR